MIPNALPDSNVTAVNANQPVPRPSVDQMPHVMVEFAPVCLALPGMALISPSAAKSLSVTTISIANMTKFAYKTAEVTAAVSMLATKANVDPTLSVSPRTISLRVSVRMDLLVTQPTRGLDVNQRTGKTGAPAVLIVTEVASA